MGQKKQSYEVGRPMDSLKLPAVAGKIALWIPGHFFIVYHANFIYTIYDCCLIFITAPLGTAKLREWQWVLLRA